LDTTALPGWPTGSIRRRLRTAPLFDPRDWALAEQITIGVIKNLLLLRHAIEHHSGRRIVEIDPVVQKILAISLYQLRFLTRIPASAAVDEAVQQAKRFGLGRAAGFVNAVLRNAVRQGPPPLPNPLADPVGYAEVALSHPQELFERMAALLGAVAALELCRHNNGVPPMIVRLMPGADPAALAAAGVNETPHEQAGMWVIEGAKVSHFAAWAAAGIAQVQDPTAALVAPACDVQAGQEVLDRCAGRGTKTLQLREAAGDGGSVYAIDASDARCADLREMVRARQLANITVLHGPTVADRGADLPATFDRILIDAPCSNSGVLARRPEARYTQTPKMLQSLAKLQYTAPRAAVGGLLIYSTCSIWPEENGRQVERLMSAYPDFELRHQQTTWPHSGERAGEYRDGGYFAVLRRSGVISSTASPSPSGRGQG
jgi:16S rRNA (cytosine967-C5)-methyltransferase